MRTRRERKGERDEVRAGGRALQGDEAQEV